MENIAVLKNDFRVFLNPVAFQHLDDYFLEYQVQSV